MLIKRLHLKNLLSFKDTTVELGQLNVLIGPNAVGKSNFIEALGLLQAAPTSLTGAIFRGGGPRQMIWLGGNGTSPGASLESELQLTSGRSVSYALEFAERSEGFIILREEISKVNPDSGSDGIYLRREQTDAKFGSEAAKVMQLPTLDMFLSHNESVLAQFKNPADSTPITEVGRDLSRIRIFREFRTGPQSAVRYGVSTSAAKDGLIDGSENLAMMLLELDFLGEHDRIKSYLCRFCDRFEDVRVHVGEGLARTYLRESGLSEMLSAIRMSDGTLKFLSLLVALFHPSPPRLICIEEPEIGLHPDALQMVADALIEASHSTQLIITTHSDALIDALTDRPETVLVCERDFDNGTQMKRLSKANLKDWLQRYTLGELWRKGEIGGGRW